MASTDVSLHSDYHKMLPNWQLISLVSHAVIRSLNSKSDKEKIQVVVRLVFLLPSHVTHYPVSLGIDNTYHYRYETNKRHILGWFCAPTKLINNSVLGESTAVLCLKILHNKKGCNGGISNSSGKHRH